MNNEITPILKAVPSNDFNKYKYTQTLIERLSNPHIKDNALRICMDSTGNF